MNCRTYGYLEKFTIVSEKHLTKARLYGKVKSMNDYFITQPTATHSSLPHQITSVSTTSHLPTRFNRFYKIHHSHQFKENTMERQARLELAIANLEDSCRIQFGHWRIVKFNITTEYKKSSEKNFYIPVKVI